MQSVRGQVRDVAGRELPDSGRRRLAVALDAGDQAGRIGVLGEGDAPTHVVAAALVEREAGVLGRQSWT
ncbi:hypothetical protein STRTUCAR8_09205 [Streptomyces turgidiscabies Car8]|uniref:Uncharacterized protein n=1 Tax=Streptomyces turgidiscabies (strain Car8) TaxID=698760 RepID=L7F0Z9_STRT8|nr:hypothetical protein STRTUCAR8_09205 [Streptomyces turgidiscabies Car8]